MSNAVKSSCISAGIIMGQRPEKSEKKPVAKPLRGRIWAVTVNFRLMGPCGEWAVDSTFAVSKDFV